ncbi:MAG: flagellar basal body rod protein FlgB [Geminicoccaceae bacterium]
MLTGIPFFALAAARLAHASQRNTVIARNIANADTPGFKAKDIEPFDFQRMTARAASGVAPKATRPGHVSKETLVGPQSEIHDAPATAESPDGNTVSLEEQMVQAADTRAIFELAANLYAKNLSLLRTVIGRDRS